MTNYESWENEELNELEKYRRTADVGGHNRTGTGASTGGDGSIPDYFDQSDFDCPFSETGSFTNGWCDALNFGDGSDSGDGGDSNNNNNNNNNNTNNNG